MVIERPHSSAHRGCRGAYRCASRMALLIGALAVTSLVLPLVLPRPASAQGLFDFLFGAFSQRPAQQETYPAPPAPGIGRVAPAPLGQESVNESGGSTHYTR